MAEPKPILIPLLNSNEVEACLVSLHVQEGQSVRDGDMIASLETTKSSGEILAEGDGYIVGLRYTAGDSVKVGDTLAFLADSPEPHLTPPPPVPSQPDEMPDGLRITEPALQLARQSGLDLHQLPIGPLVTEAQVRSLAGSTGAAPLDATPPAFDPTAILVYGGGGHGKSVIDLLRVLGIYTIIGVLDDGLPAGSSILGVPVLGGGEQLPELFQRGCHLAVNAVGGIGQIGIRMHVFDRLAQAGLVCPAVVHPAAFVEASARLSPGVQIFPHAYVGSDSQVGFGAIVNTGAIVSHDCILGSYSNVSPGAMLAGAVKVGERALIGMGATVNLEVHIGPGARIGNGATVKSDVPAGGIVRAGGIWPGEAV